MEFFLFGLRSVKNPGILSGMIISKNCAIMLHNIEESRKPSPHDFW